MLPSLLDEEDRSLLESMYEGRGRGERARGWRRPELAGEDLEKMMQELLLQRSFGPEQLRKYRERLEARGETEEGLAEASSPGMNSAGTGGQEDKKGDERKRHPAGPRGA
jgi:hypothetical protein